LSFYPFLADSIDDLWLWDSLSWWKLAIIRTIENLVEKLARELRDRDSRIEDENRDNRDSRGWIRSIDSLNASVPWLTRLSLVKDYAVRWSKPTVLGHECVDKYIGITAYSHRVRPMTISQTTKLQNRSRGISTGAHIHSFY